MDISSFTEAAPVVRQLDDLQAWWDANNPQVSDILDADGHQYIDIVLEGGGVLGIALVGYTHVLERMGIRFLGIGGASAGAINAALLAAVSRPNEEKSRAVLGMLADLDLRQFVDGDDDARDFSHALVERAGPFKMYWKGAQVLDNFRNDLGLNPGDAFESWVAGVLASHGAATVKQLESKMCCDGLGLLHRDGTPRPDERAQLRLVAADITTETKAIFPLMADLYFDDPDDVPAARLVRASMAIPGFFHPMRVRDIPDGKEAVRRWRRKTRYLGRKLPEEVVFVDGGIISNFPINLFHEEGVPCAPTFGVKLGLDIAEPRRNDTIWQLLASVFDTARHALDTDFIHNNDDYDLLVTKIDTGDHHWLDFALSDDAKVDLFARGVAAGARFLKSFDWAAYKRVRQELSTPNPAPLPS